ncbi:GEVED domain-containing protein [Streptomyces sp. NPDC059002]|uniref:DUF7927 domain-containing protein n=1 Tax=Streptomyces sp. NPDC059002 TaxID=3346690 RepID=UPI003687FD41
MRRLLRTGLVLAVMTSQLTGLDVAWAAVESGPSVSASASPEPAGTPGPGSGRESSSAPADDDAVRDAVDAAERQLKDGEELARKAGEQAHAETSGGREAAGAGEAAAEGSPKRKDKAASGAAKESGADKDSGTGKRSAADKESGAEKQKSEKKSGDREKPEPEELPLDDGTPFRGGTRAQKAGSYTVSGTGGTGSLPSGTTVAITTTGAMQNASSNALDGGTVTAPSGLAGSASVGILWPTGGSTSYTERGSVTFTFSRPVRNPRLHIAGMGAQPGGNMRLRLTDSAPASASPTLSKLAGFTDWTVSDTQVSNSYSSANASCTAATTSTTVTSGCGTVGVSGTVSSVTLAVDTRNNAGSTTGDGVRFLATVDEDFSNSADLPAASHTLSDLKLGALSTGDSPDTVITTPGIKADDDADGIASWPAVAANKAGSSYAVDVALTSPSASTLSGWVDWNGNGTLDDGERADAAPAAGASTARLTWTVPTDVKSGTHPARIRIGYDATATQKASGWADSGEVEDYTMTVTKAANLEISKTVDTTTPRLGDEVLFTISVKNTGPDDTTGVKVTDKLPNGLTYVSDDSGGKYDSSTGVWSAGDLKKNETKTFNLVAKTTKQGQITNTASTATSDELTDAVTGSSVTLNVGPASECPKIAELTNGSFESPVNTSTVQFYGDAGQPAPNVPGWRTTATDNKIEIWRGPATSGGTPGGSITAADGQQWAELNANQVSTLYQDLSTTPGLKMNWRIFHRGRQGNDTMQVKIGPSDGTLIAQTPTGASSPDITTGTGAWQEYRGTYTIPAGQRITRFAFASIRGTGGASIGNFLDGIRFGTPGCLTTKKSVTRSPDRDPSQPTDVLTYTVEAKNEGGDDAFDAFLRDPIPANSDFVPGSIQVTKPDGTTTAVSDASGYDSANKRVTAPIGSGSSPRKVAPGETWKMTYKVKIARTAGGSKVINQATAGWKETPDGSDTTERKTNTTTTNIGETVDIKVDVNDLTIAPGSSGDVTLTTTNDGPNAAKGVKTVYEIPPGTTVDTSSLPTGCTGGAAGPITCTVGDLAVGQTKTHTFKLKVPADAVPGTTATGTATTSTTSNEPDEWKANNKDTNRLTVGTRQIALEIKKTAKPNPLTVGQKVTYTVTTTNKGPSDALDVKVRDTVPANFTDVTWSCTVDGTTTCGSGTGNSVSTTVARIPAGKSAVITITGTLKADPGVSPVKNTAQATAPADMTDTACPDKKGPCTHETENELDTKSLRITKSVSTTKPLPGQEITYTVKVANTGSVTYEDATFEDDLTDVVDDATYVANSQSADIGTAAYTAPKLRWSGDVPADKTATITYKVKVDSPPKGNKKLKNTVTSDVPGTNCPAGSTDPKCSTGGGDDGGIPSLKFKKVMSPKSPLPGQKVSYTVTVENDGEAAYPGVEFTDDLSDVVDDATYNGDEKAVSGGSDYGTVSYAKPDLKWSGDLAKGQKVTVTYSVTVDDPPKGNKVLKNTVTSDVPGSNCPEGSTDPDCGSGGKDDGGLPNLVFKKVMSPKSPLPGQKVSYTVTVENDGEGAYPGVKFTDDLSDVVDDATYNGDEKAVSGGSDYGTVAYTKPKLTWTGDLAAGQKVTVTYSVTVDDPPKGNKILKNTVTSDVPGSNCPPGSKDPTCGSGGDQDGGLPNLTYKKVMSPKSPLPGQKVSYTVTVENDGEGAYPGVEFTDDLSDVVDDATYNGDEKAVSGGSDYGTVSYAKPHLKWTGDLAKGQKVTVTYSVTVDSPPKGNKKLKNTVTSDVPGSNCPEGSTDPDCGSGGEDGGGLPNLKFKKVMSPKNPLPGQKVSYTVTMENDGNAPYPGVKFTDNLSDVIDDATYNQDEKAVLDGSDYGTVKYTEPELTWSGDVDAGKTVTLTYSVTVDDPPKGNKSLKNTVTSDVPGSNCPEGSLDPDCFTGQGEGGLPNLVYKKVMAPKNPTPGQKVTYTVTVENDGKAGYPDVKFTDDLSDVVDDATYNEDAAALSGGKAHGTVAYAEPKLTWTGDLASGQTVTVTYSVTVDAPPKGNKALKNTVTSDVPGSNCPAGSKDPDCTSGGGEEGGIPVIRFVKTADPSGAATAGGRVTYTVKVINEGTSTYKGATFSDDLSGVLDDAAYNDNAAATSGDVGYARPEVTWTGDVPAGGTVTVTYSVTVDNPVKGDKQLTNSVTSTTPGTNCPLPMPTRAARGPIDPDCSTGPSPVKQLTVRKQSDAGDKVRPGDTITYTVSVTNTGSAPYPGATFSDDLSGVLDDARYNGDGAGSTGSVDFSSPTLSWTGDLTPGQRATITYSVTVKPKGSGDGKVANRVITPDGSGGNCPAGSTDPDCTGGPVPPEVVDPIKPPPVLPETGDRGRTRTLLAGGAAIVLVGVGAWLVAVVRRRRNGTVS